MLMTIEQAIALQADHANEGEKLHKALAKLVQAADEDLPYLPQCEDFAIALHEARQLLAN